MIDETNPFIRGYQALSIHRVLIVSYDDESPLTYLPLHSSQAHLADLEVTCSSLAAVRSRTTSMSGG